MKISIITPSLNSGFCIERAIESVLRQQYSNFEHIVIDGGSTDNTLAILQKYSHLRWISEPDRNQVHAMNKGFELSTGDLVVYLNADDYFLDGAFKAVIKAFTSQADMVMGQVEVLQEQACAVEPWSSPASWINDPRTDFVSILRHWEPNAFCVNPVGYFYKRHVQEAIPFLEEHGPKMDLAFLLAVSQRFIISKLDYVLGVFEYAQTTQTAKEQALPSYWREDNFVFITEAAKHYMDEDALRIFTLDRQRGYQKRRHETVQTALQRGNAQSLIQAGELFFLPQTETEVDEQQMLFVEHCHPATKGDWIFLVLSHGKVASKSIDCLLTSLEVLSEMSTKSYHLHLLHNVKSSFQEWQAVMRPSEVSQIALDSAMTMITKNMRVKIIVGVRDPIETAISGRFELLDCNADIDMKVVIDYVLNWFDMQLLQGVGIDIFEYPFDKESGYTIIQSNNIEILVYTLEALPRVCAQAMKEFTGIENCTLPAINMAKDKSYSAEYKKACEQACFDSKFLDEVYTSKYVQHFYSEEKIQELYAHWERKIIYDVGFFDGSDTEFYLKKGFKVVGIDANPQAISKGTQQFSQYIETGQLVLLNVGIIPIDCETAEDLVFYVSETLPQWSSFEKKIACRDGNPFHTVHVECRTLADIIREHGQPYYVKIDIEGYDYHALQSLESLDIKPTYVSVENGNGNMLNCMHSMGYSKFKYINQATVPDQSLPNPPLEGVYCEHTFTFGSSGAFGEETPGMWQDFFAIQKTVSKVWNLKTGQKNPRHNDAVDGWFDLHSKRT